MIPEPSKIVEGATGSVFQTIADHHVGPIAHDRLEKRMNILRKVRIVAIDNDENVGIDVFNIDGSLFISGTTISGTVGTNVFLFDAPGIQVLAGSTGNVNATTNNPTLCEAGAGSFTGTISFVDGINLQDNVAPCN